MRDRGFFNTMEKEITAIEAQKRTRNRLNIFLDGTYAFSLDRLTAAWLKPGRKLSENEIQTLQAKDAMESAYTRTLHFLSYRARSAQELDAYLQGKGFEEPSRLAVLERLKNEGYLDDARFSADWVENRCEFRPRSQTLLRTELRHKGIPEDTIDATFEKAQLDDAQLAEEAAKKAARRYAGLEWEDFRKRLGNYLLRRGFSFADARQASSKLWAQLKADEQAHKNSKKMEHLTQ